MPSVSASSQPVAGSCDATPLTNAPIPNGFGINAWGSAAADLNGIKAAGFCWIRTDLTWAVVETSQGIYNFRAFDTILAALEQRSLHPLFILDYTNPLYHSAGASTQYGGQITTESERQAFTRYATAAVNHYQGHKIIWELWNEPNHLYSPSNYMALANEVLPAIRQADPQAYVVAPGTEASNAIGGTDIAFLSPLFSQGLLSMINGVSIHPYRNTPPETFAADYASLQALIAQNHGHNPIVSGEWGYPTGTNFTTAQQGQYLARMFLHNLSLGTVLSIWFDWSTTDPMGIAPVNGVSKPGYQEMQRLTTTLNGLTFQRSLTAAAGDYILLFSGNGRTMLAAWTTGNTHAVTLPDGKSITLTNDPLYTTP